IHSLTTLDSECAAHSLQELSLAKSLWEFEDGFKQQDGDWIVIESVNFTTQPHGLQWYCSATSEAIQHFGRLPVVVVENQVAGVLKKSAILGRVLCHRVPR